MRTKLFRIALALIVTIVCLYAAFTVGYDRGQTAFVQESDTRSLEHYLALYGFQQQGDTNQLSHLLRGMVFSSYKDCERDFGSNYLAHLSHYSLMIGREHTNFVVFDPATIIRQVSEEMRTNRGPNTALEPTPTAP